MSEDIETEKTVLLREIVVAIDTSSHSRAALEAAVALAAMTGADIRGIFVEDERWDKISQIPSTSVVNADTGHLLPFEGNMLKDRIRILKNRLRRDLESLSKKNKVEYSLAFSSGKVEEKILEAAKKADLITIGLRGHSARRNKMGSSAKKIIRQADKPVLVLKKGLNLGHALTVFYDGSEESRKGLELSETIAERNNVPLTVLLSGEDSDNLKNRNHELKELLKDIDVPVEIETLRRKEMSSILNEVNKRNSGLLVVPKDEPPFVRSLDKFLNYLKCPVLMMN